MIAGHSGARQRSSALRIAAVALLCAAALMIWQAAASIHALRRADCAGTMLRQIEAVQRSLLWVRAEYRSAILSGDEQSLALYRDADRQLQSNLDQLSLLTLGDPERQHAITELQRLVDRSRTQRERILTLRSTSIEAARSALMNTEVLQARSASTPVIAELARSAQAELTAHAAGERQALLWLFASTMGLLVAAAAMVAFAIRNMRRFADQVSSSEARYRALSDDCPDGILVVVEERVVYANEAALELWGARTEPAVLGRKLIELLHPDDRETVAARIQTVLAHGIATSPRIFRLLRGDGTTYEIEARKTLIHYAGNPAVQVMARDVTARRTSELALALSEQRFRSVLDAMVEGVVLQDETGAIKLCNRAAERILGLRIDQMAQSSAAGPRALDESGAQLPGDRNYAMIALRTGQGTADDMNVQRPDGSRALLHVSAIPLFRPGADRPYAVTTTFADITQERAALQSLRESMAQYQLLAENSADMISRRTLDHRFEYVSPSHTAILGWSREELLAIAPLDLIHPDDIQHIKSGSLASIARGESSPATTLRVRHKAGHYVWVEGISTPIRDASGKVVAYTVCARDITARRLLEQQLRQAQKLEAMGRMAGAVAHDFNNILTVIRGATELLAVTRRPANDSDVAEYVADVGAAVDRAAQLTTSLLSVSHGQHTLPRLLSVGEVLRESRDLLRRMLPDRCSLQLQVKLAAGKDQIWGDQGELLHTLANLVGNAADAMPQGGTILLECGVEQLSQLWTHRFGTLPRGSYVTISVTDGGRGMDPPILEHIFEPFFTTKPLGKGAGLGLATVWGIVQQAHGTVTVDSVPERGSRFTIYWPRSDTSPHASSIPGSAALQPSARSAPVPVAQSFGRTVLVVDDEPAVLRVTTRLLERSGYRVHAARSGAEALRVVKEQRRALQLIVSDVRMPEMSGIELVSQLLAAGIDMPVLFISGQLDTPLPTDWPRTAQRRFLAKPFTLEQLLAAIEHLLHDAAFEPAQASN